MDLDQDALTRDHQKTFESVMKVAAYSLGATLVLMAFLALFFT